MPNPNFNDPAEDQPPWDGEGAGRARQQPGADIGWLILWVMGVPAAGLLPQLLLREKK